MDCSISVEGTWKILREFAEDEHEYGQYVKGMRRRVKRTEAAINVLCVSGSRQNAPIARAASAVNGTTGRSSAV